MNAEPIVSESKSVNKINISPPIKEYFSICINFRASIEEDDATKNEEEDGTSKFLTMKVANRLLGVMMV